MKPIVLLFLSMLLNVVLPLHVVQAGPLTLETVESAVRGQTIPRALQGMATTTPKAQDLLRRGATGEQKPFYGGNSVSGIVHALMEDALIVARDPGEFLGAMEITVIGMCYRIHTFWIEVGPYMAYYWPTQINEMADTFQSEYIPTAVFDAMDGVLSPEETLYPKIQGDDQALRLLGVDAPHALARAAKVAARTSDFDVPDSANVASQVTRLPRALLRHSGGDGTTNHKEWRYLPHPLQLAYAMGGGASVLGHKARISNIPLIPSEMPLLNEMTRMAEWSSLLFPEVMGLPEMAGEAGSAANAQFGLKGNPGRCIGHNIRAGNTPVLPFFNPLAGQDILRGVNQGFGYRLPFTNRDICTQNIGSDYPVTTFADVPVSRLPHLSYIRSLNLLGHPMLAPLTGGTSGGFFDFKKYRSIWGRADKVQFRGSNKDGKARFLMDRADNTLWRSLMGDTNSWVADAQKSPESFLSNKHRPGIDPDDPGRAVSYQWSGFRVCPGRQKPWFLFGFTSDNKKPQIRGYERWPGGGARGGRL